MTASTVQSWHSASRTCCIDVVVAASILSVTVSIRYYITTKEERRGREQTCSSPHLATESDYCGAARALGRVTAAHPQTSPCP